MKTVNYLHGFLNHFESEAIPNSLPKNQNSPQKPDLGLYAEQLSGTAFTAPRHRNLKTWLYKTQPSAQHGKFEEVGHHTWISEPQTGKVIKTPQALRFKPYENSKTKNLDFIDSLFTYAINGSVFQKTGCAIHLYSCSKSMTDKYFYNADAEMMIVPESGDLTIFTELGILELSPLFIGVIPRGIRFKVDLKSAARGYVCENFGAPFALPELGPIGANGLAHGRHFEVPTAAYENKDGNFELITRYQGSTWRAPISHSPLNTVAWHGNYVPYRYDLRKFNTINSVSFDHPDPSIFTVLTSATTEVGTANIDFVIFPPRWMVAEKTFRPPYFHRNVMNEFMGLIQGEYDAKPDGFLPGGASIHNCMTGHGPDANAFLKASNAELKPEQYKNTMALMWESTYPFWPTEQAINSGLVDEQYHNAWLGLPKLFKEN